MFRLIWTLSVHTRDYLHRYMPSKPKSSTARRRQVLGRGQPVGVRIAVQPGTVPTFGNTEYPLDQLAEVSLFPPRHPQPQVPLVASHARQVHRPRHGSHFRPSAHLHFEVTRILQIEEEGPESTQS